MDEFVVEDKTKLVDRQAKASERDKYPAFDPTLFEAQVEQEQETAEPVTIEEEEAKQKATDYARFQRMLPAPFYFPPAVQNGMRDAANSIKNLPIDVASFAAEKATGNEEIGEKAEELKEATKIPEVEMEDTLANNLARGLTQFFVPFGAVSKLNKLSSTTKLGSAGVAAVNGAIVDFTAFDSSEERLADIAKEAGLDNPLASDEDDTAIMKRWKTTLEGAGLGVMFDAFAQSVRALKGAKRAKTLADTAGEKAAKSRVKLEKARKAAKQLKNNDKLIAIKEDDIRAGKEVIDVETQRKFAEAIGTTYEDVVDSKEFQKELAKSRDVVNSYTLVEEQAFEAFQDEAAEHAVRLQNGDLTARDDFIDSMYGVLDVHGTVQDAVQDIARAQGFRSQVGAVRQINQLRDLIARSAPEEVDDLIQAVGEARTPEEIRAMLKGMSKADYTQHTSLREFTERLFMNNILASPVTLASDTISNVTFTLYNKTLEKPIAAGIGGLRHMLGGSADRVRLREGLEFYNALGQDAIDVAKLLKRGYDNAGLRGAASAAGEAIEQQKVENFTRFGFRNRQPFLTPERLSEIPPHLQGPAQWAELALAYPSNFMQTKDDVVKGFLYRSSVRERATRAALNEGLTPGTPKFIARVKDLQQSPIDDVAKSLDAFSIESRAQFDKAVKELGADEAALRWQIQEKAVRESRKLTFTDPASKVAEGVNNVADHIPGGRFIVPFVTTIDNLIRRSLDRSPIRALSPDFYETVQRGGAEADEEIARVLTGTTLMVGAYYMAMNGYATGDGFTNTSDRNAALDNGYRPRSFFVNGKYIDFSRQLGPLALMFQIPANVAELAKMRDAELDGDIERDLQEYVSLGALAFGKTLLSQSYARGIADLFENLDSQDEGRMTATLDNIAASLAVPNSVSFIANQINPELQAAEGVWERIQAKVGMLDKPKHNVFGEKIKRDDYLSVLMPATVKDVSDVPAWKAELYRANAYPSKPSKRISVSLFEDGAGNSLASESSIELNSEQYERLLQLVGEKGLVDLIKTAVNSPIWESLPDVEMVDGSQRSKREFIKELYREFLDEAKRDLIQEYPELQLRAREKALLRRTTPGMSPMATTINERIQGVRRKPTVTP